MNIPQKYIDRFWSHIEKNGPDDCWPWLKGQDSFGYGKCWMGFHAATHRVVLMLKLNRILLTKEYATHSCDNRICCNPYHIVLGTHASNMQDMVNKGRQRAPKGSKHALAVLDEIKVKNMREDYASMRFPSHRKIAKKYGVAHSTALAVLNRETWKHVQ